MSFGQDIWSRYFRQHDGEDTRSTPCITRKLTSREPDAMTVSQGVILLDLGFQSGADLWPPWCAAFVQDEVAAVAFCARLSDDGAELGLVTVKHFRGQGLAAAVTAAWTHHPELERKKLFYSMDTKNESSQKVAERLGLMPVGWSLRIY